MDSSSTVQGQCYVQFSKVKVILVPALVPIAWNSESIGLRIQQYLSLTGGNRMSRCCSEWCVAVPVLALLAVGCGDSRYVTAEVHGRAVLDGNPVTAGTITFTPVETDGAPRDGKTAVGTLQSNGVFALTTYESDDGAIVGKHRVHYFPPEETTPETVNVEVDTEGQEIAAEVRQSEDSPIMELEVSESSRIVEVQSGGSNEIRIELTPVTANDGNEEEVE